MTSNWTQRIRHEKYPPYHNTYIGPQVPNFHPFCSTVSHFQDIAHFRIFPIDFHVKNFKICNFWRIEKHQKFIILYSPMTALFITKFDSEWPKTVGGVAPWNFQLQDFKCHQCNFFSFGRWQKKYQSLYSLITNILIIKFALNRMNWGIFVKSDMEEKPLPHPNHYMPY